MESFELAAVISRAFYVTARGQALDVPVSTAGFRLVQVYVRIFDRPLLLETAKLIGEIFVFGLFCSIYLTFSPFLKSNVLERQLVVEVLDVAFSKIFNMGIPFHLPTI